MVFVDHAQIVAKAGDGGRGCSSFAQPPYIRYPYPDGGDGGDGGHVMLRADSNVATLLDFRYRHEFAAGRGGHGGSNQKTGKRGEDVVLRIPVGTVVSDAKTEELLRDLATVGEECIVVRGGRGGLGNATIATVERARSQSNRPSHRRKKAGARDAASVRQLLNDQALGQATTGTPGESRRLTLEFKLIADIGMTGFPNAGKSSFLSRISTAKPKVGAYPFTTRYPVLGVVRVDAQRSFIACDIPGLIEGAHQGRGLGIEFLRHVERTRLLVHLIDMAGVDGKDPVQAFGQLNRELRAYNPALADKPQLVVANKMDLPEAHANLKAFQRAVGGRVWPISCATGEGVLALIRAMWELLQASREAMQPEQASALEIERHD